LGDDDGTIAEFLGMALETFRTNLRKIYAKLGIHARFALALEIMRAHEDWLFEGCPPQGCNGRRVLA